MTHIRKLRLVLPARFAKAGPAAAREIAERMIDANHGQESTLTGPIQLQDTGQTPAQIGLQAARMAQAKLRRDGGDL